MNNFMLKMIIVTLTLLGLMEMKVLAQHHQHQPQQQHQQQQQIDQGYLRQYYQQLQQQQHLSNNVGGGSVGVSGDAAPIYEQHVEQPEQYLSSGQQLRVKDAVQEQIRVQQQQQQQQHRQQQQQQHTTAYIAPAVREYLHSQPQAQQIQYQPQTQSVIYRPQQYHSQQQQQQHSQHTQPQPQAIPRRPVSLPISVPVSSNAQYLTAPRPKGKLTLDDEEEEYDDKNSSYQFGFDVKDDEFTNYQNRKEVRDNGVITGSYSVVDSDGFIRTVKYTADPKEGFKAEVIREPTDIVVKIPTPAPNSLLRHHAKAQQFAIKPQYQ